MRAVDYFEAYLDDFDKIVIFFSKESYDGVSRQFYLRDDFGNIDELQILSVEPLTTHIKYTCRVLHEIEIGREYQVLHQFARSTILQYSYIVKRPAFDEMFAYTGNDLGANYTPTQTTFVVWAPTAAKACLEIQRKDQPEIHMMEKGERGTFRLTLKGDYELAKYVYHIRVNGSWNESIDPYGKSSTINSTRSVVIDTNKIKMQEYSLPILHCNTKAIIYETSVRDFTMKPNIGISNPGKFKGFVEENETTKSLNTGFSYLKTLGVTHVQLMPVLDFGSVDEYNQHLFYNWGYDPLQYMTLEGSYASNSFDPMSRINDFSELVNKLHASEMRLVLDVVFNHVFDLPSCSFQKIVPGYYFQMNDLGHYSNGTWCGNDFDSTGFMAKKFIVDACVYLTKTFKIDGFRFDLMGILDVDTLNEVYQRCREINRDFMIYGEGWDMPSYLDPNRRASIANHEKMPMVAHFSDRFRDVIKGRTSVEEIDVKGYCSNDLSLIQVAKDVLSASVTNRNNIAAYFSSPQQAVNYVECHDNMTCWDKLKSCCREDTRETRIKRQQLCIAAVLFAQGIPFIHSGQEFARTKHGKPNTYCDSDSINRIDYERRNRYLSIVEFTKDCIELRKSLPCFSYATTEDILEYVSFDEINHSALVYKMKDEINDVAVIFNPTQNYYEYDMKASYQLIFKNGKITPEEQRIVKVEPLSVLVLRRN